MPFRSIFAISIRLLNGIARARRSAMLFARGASDAGRSLVFNSLQNIRPDKEPEDLFSRKTMKDTLLIDDVRVMAASRVARTYDEAIAQIKEKTPDLLLLDHDLGEIEPNKTGYGIVLFLEENNIKPKEIRLVTANPVGAMKMEAALESMGYKYDNYLRVWYIK